MNFLVPRSIGIYDGEEQPRPVFLDFGLSVKATTKDLRSGRVPSPARRVNSRSINSAPAS